MSILEQQIIYETKGLAPDILIEILDFIQFVKQKELKKASGLACKCDVDVALRQMEAHELTHLEEEFKDYRELYPYDK